MVSKLQPLSEIVRDSVANTTAHAIGRVAPASRPVALRVFWLLVFLSFLGLLLNTCIVYIGKLNSPGVKSEFEAEKVPFEFPDVYFCNSLQTAGSFTCRLNKSEVDQVKTPFYAASATFQDALNSLNSSANITAALDELRPTSLIQSLPYKVLADIVGQRKLQTFYMNFGIFSAGSEPTLDKPIAVETLYHPNHLKCFKLALTDAELLKMQNTNSRLKLNLHLDPYFRDFDESSLFSPPDQRLPNMTTIVSGKSVNVYPYDWDLENPIEFDKGSGMYLYLTPRGQYPSRLTSTVVSLGPGRAYDISIAMRDVLMKQSDFPGKCVSQHDEPVLFLNPRTGSADAFSYSEAHCYYSEIARSRQQMYNCSPSPDPTPWEFRHLALCLNLTAAASMDTIHRNMNAFLRAREDADSANSSWDKAFSEKRLCNQRLYDETSSYGLWPNQGSLIRLVENLLGSMIASVDPTDYRSLETGVKIMSSMNPADIKDRLGFENGVSRYFSRAAVSVTLRADATMSSLTTFSLDYNLSQFIADFGSALGLYLGCSLLTVLELFELLHDVILRASCLRRADNTLE